MNSLLHRLSIAPARLARFRPKIPCRTGMAALALAALPSARAISDSDLQFLNTLEIANVRYFIDQAQSANSYLMPNSYATGTSTPDPRLCDESTGLELVALSIADSHGPSWYSGALTHAQLLSRVQIILEEMASVQTAIMTSHPDAGGLFWHYMNSPSTGALGSQWIGSAAYPQYGPSNIGTDDGARFLNGVLVARQQFAPDATVIQYANQIFNNINWQAWVDTGNQLCYEAWTPPVPPATLGTFGGSYWGRYSEGPLQVYLMGMAPPWGSPVGTAPGPNAFTLTNWNAWSRTNSTPYKSKTTGVTYNYIGSSPALFTQQFPQGFLYLYGMLDDSTGGNGTNYWNNSVVATEAQWAWSQDIAQAVIAGEGKCPLWGVNLWGLTSSNAQPVNGSEPFNTWGGPIASPEPPDGTLTPAAAAGSLPFTPAYSLQTLEYMYKNYPQIWMTDHATGDAYGFVDAFLPGEGALPNGPVGAPPLCTWVDGLTDGQFNLSTNGTGQTLIMAENYLTGFVWQKFMSAIEIQKALSVAQFDPTAVSNTGVWETTPFAPSSSTFTVTFNAAPAGFTGPKGSDSLVAFSQGAQTQTTQYAAAVRFAANGDILAENAGTFEGPTTPILYASGTVYQFQLVINQAAQTYTITVAPILSNGNLGTKQTVGTAYRFTAAATSLDHWGAMMETGGSGTMTVTDLYFTPQL